MKKTILLALIGGLTLGTAAAQSFGDVLNDVLGGSSSNQTQSNSNNKGGISGRNGASVNNRNGATTNNNNNSNKSYGNLSNNDIVGGLKEALRIGAQNAGGKLSATDGFLGNALIKIVMPPEAKQVESTLRQMGMGSIADKAIVAMNRAAEDAAKQAAPIFINAITSMSINDGVNILTGGNNAATNYLKSRTTQALANAFRPVIERSLSKVNATQLWNSVFSTYNSLPLVQNKINPDLTAYVTERALNGLFVTIAQEEQKIRTNPAAQVTNLLQRVFGNR